MPSTETKSALVRGEAPAAEAITKSSRTPEAQMRPFQDTTVEMIRLHVWNTQQF
jgi:hypothetical protein